MVISPYTRTNYVSSNEINTASVVKFIEDNWLHGQRIANSYDAVSGSLDGRGGVLNFNTEHDAEMYGTIAVYLRLKGIVPPSSEGK